MAVPIRGFGKNRRLLSAVTAVPHRGISRKSRRRSTGYATHAATKTATGDFREYLPERWPCLIDYFNVEVAKYEATSGAENQG
jgi:hypothetical protein